MYINAIETDMHKFKLDIEIERPVNDVYSMFINRSLQPKWQPGLLEDEPIDDHPGKEHYSMLYRIGNRSMKMTETIIKKSFPQYDAHYKLKGIRNAVQHTFREAGPNTTRWTSVNEFRFVGLMKLIGPFMRSGLEQQSRIIMKNFKTFAEKQ